ncbi:hypothetical protein M0R19_03050 [Candidatus Pacearchaeota archaeon]|jgi:hypothetical protein|nr:hypothetical protein [Candidatus Pacearchaeota archaeon]
MTDCFILSKNRASQLHLLLTSINEHFIDVEKIYVLYTYSNDFFKQGYNKLFKKMSIFNMDLSNLDIIPILESSFREDLLDIFKKEGSDHILGLCDDNMFFKDANISETLSKVDFKYNDIFSLRVGKNINITYEGNLPEIPVFLNEKEYLKWEWRILKRACFGFPSCIDNHVYNRKFLYDFYSKHNFNSPPKMEEVFTNNANKIFGKFIYSFEHSKTVNICMNMVQTVSLSNPFGKKYFYSLDELNQKFIDGIVIVPEIDKDKINCIHQEFKMNFINVSIIDR